MQYLILYTGERVNGTTQVMVPVMPVMRVDFDTSVAYLKVYADTDPPLLHSDNVSIAWTLPNGTELLTSDGRFTLRNFNRELQIQDVGPQDNGIYHVNLFWKVPSNSMATTAIDFGVISK